jgi:hypothetical protein
MTANSKRIDLNHAFPKYAKVLRTVAVVRILLVRDCRNVRSQIWDTKPTQRAEFAIDLVGPLKIRFIPSANRPLPDAVLTLAFSSSGIDVAANY